MSSVQTVTGPIEASDLGITNLHTHVLVDTRPWFVEPEEASLRHFADLPLTLETLGAIRRNGLGNRANLLKGDIVAATRELGAFKAWGGRTIVEVSPRGIGRDPLGLLQIANLTGLNIVCCAGFYIGASHPALVAHSTVEELTAVLVKELTEGIGDTGVRAGVLKIGMGTSDGGPFGSVNEEKAFHAVARAHASTGAAIEIHPARPYTERHWDTYLDIVEGAGGDLEKVCACHMEFWAQDLDYHRAVADRGAILGFDQFGSEEYFSSRGDGYPADQLRVDAVVALAHAGLSRHVVISNEVALRCEDKAFGGHGYSHVLENIVPELRSRGVSEQQLDDMLHGNAARLLPF